MTVFGKILTFIILVLALAQAALHVAFHVAQTNYAQKNEQLAASVTAANAQIESLNKALVDEKTGRAADLAKQQDETKKAQDELAVAKKANTDLANKNTLLEHQVNKRVADQLVNNADVKALEGSNTQLAKAVEARDDKIKEMITTVNDFRQAKVKAEIEANSFRLRNEQLVEQIKEKDVELARAKSIGGGTGGGAAGPIPVATVGGAATAKNPPQANVEGLITRTDPTSGMVTVSVGTDAGVIKGNTLEVFRLNPPKYLGTIRILDAKPNEAVGKPVNRPLGQINQGDRVAAKILGG